MSLKFFSKLANAMERGKETPFEIQSRRVWLQNFGLITASSAVVWACGSDDDDKATAVTVADDPKADSEIVKVAIGLENEAIGLYTAAAGLTIWTSDTDKVILAIAASFLAHHQTHLKTLQDAMVALKAKDATITDAAAAKTPAEYAAAATGADLTTVAGVMRLAANKEAGAAKAYLSVASKFTSKDLADFSGLHGGDEAGHYGVLRAALATIPAYSAGSGITAPGMVIPSALASGFDQQL